MLEIDQGNKKNLRKPDNYATFVFVNRHTRDEAVSRSVVTDGLDVETIFSSGRS